MATPEQFRAAMDVCVEAYAEETAPEAKLRLARAAFVFAQVAEHLERGLPLTQVIVATCRDAVDFLPGSARSQIEVLLSGAISSGSETRKT
jgi:hypothetical protein